MPYVALGISALGIFSLFMFQLRHTTIFPEISSKYIITVPPLLLNIGAIAAYALSPTAALNNILTAVFGMAGLVGLMLNLVVLVSIRNSITDELSLAERASEIIRKARKRLVFLALTPNVGFAAAARRGDYGVCASLTVALQEALPELAKKAQADKAEVIIGLLQPDEQAEFYDRKKTTLAKFTPGELETETSAAKSYERYTEAVMEAITSAQANGGTNFHVRYWKPKCTVPLDPNRPEDLPKDFPPLGILIGDDSAIISFNAPLVLSDQPIDVGGRLFRTRDEVESFGYLVDAYIAQYAAP